MDNEKSQGQWKMPWTMKNVMDNEKCHNLTDQECRSLCMEKQICGVIRLSRKSVVHFFHFNLITQLQFVLEISPLSLKTFQSLNSVNFIMVTSRFTIINPRFFQYVLLAYPNLLPKIAAIHIIYYDLILAICIYFPSVVYNWNSLVHNYWKCKFLVSFVVILKTRR